MEVPDDVPSNYSDGLPLLREIGESDWQLIEHLADLPMQRGDVFTSCTITAERARQLLELPIESIDSLITHLAVLRRDDLVDSLVLVDQDDSLSEAIILRWRADDARLEALERQQQAAERAAASRELTREQAWQQALADPQGTLEQMQAVIAVAATPGEAAGQLARLLGVKPARALAEMQPLIQERQLLLLGMIEAAEPPAPDPRAELLQEAQDWATGLPNTQEGLDCWARREPGGGRDWREVFRFGTQFAIGETAVLAVADAVGADPAEVRLHAAQLAAVEDLQRRQVAAAYTTAEDLLADALAAGSWGELSWAVGVAPWQLERRCCQLTVQS